MTLKSQKPLSDQYPKEIKTIGDHIRKRRLDLGLLQKEVAVQIGVDESTIYNWERQRTLPVIRFMPKIIEFLGYDPAPSENEGSFQQRIKAYRTALGLSQSKLAMKLKINPSTVWSWERGRHRPLARHEKTLLRLMDEKL